MRLASEHLVMIVLFTLVIGGGIVDAVLRHQANAAAPAPATESAWEYGVLYVHGYDLVFAAGPTRLKAHSALASNLIEGLNAQLGTDCPLYGDNAYFAEAEHVLTCLNRLGWQLDQYGQDEHGQRYILKRPAPPGA